MKCNYRDRKINGRGCKHMSRGQYCQSGDAPYRVCFESLKVKPRWSASSLKSFNVCPYKFWLGSVCGWSDKVKSQALYQGSLFGDEIQRYLMTKDKVEVEANIMADANVDDMGKLKILGWLDAMEQTVEDAVDCEIEVPFRMQMDIGNTDTLFTGYYDVKLDSISYFGFKLIENKYTVDASYYSAFGNRLQYLLYLLSSGESAMGVRIYRKPLLRIKKDESESNFRMRVKGTILSDWDGYFCPPNGYELEVGLNDYDVDEFKYEMVNVNGELKRCLTGENGFYKRYNCKTGYVCNFYNHCSECGNIEDNNNYSRQNTNIVYGQKSASKVAIDIVSPDEVKDMDTEKRIEGLIGQSNKL